MISLLITRYGFYLAAGAGLLVTVAAWRTADVHHQRSVGAERATVAIEKATSNAATLGAKAAAKSVAPASGSVRKYPTDPTTRD